MTVWVKSRHVRCLEDVRFGPKADMSPSFDNLIDTAGLISVTSSARAMGDTV